MSSCVQTFDWYSTFLCGLQTGRKAESVFVTWRSEQAALDLFPSMSTRDWAGAAAILERMFYHGKLNVYVMQQL